MADRLNLHTAILVPLLWDILKVRHRLILNATSAPVLKVSTAWTPSQLV